MTRDGWSEGEKFVQVLRNILSEPSIEQWVKDVGRMEEEGRFKQPVGDLGACGRDYYRAEDLRVAMRLAVKLMQLCEFSETHSALLPPQEELGKFAQKVRWDEYREDSRRD